MSSFVGIDTNKASYVSWFDFKKHPQNELTHCMLATQWQPIKLNQPLPSVDAFDQQSLFQLV
jgi:hypothetical protein